MWEHAGIYVLLIIIIIMLYLKAESMLSPTQPNLVLYTSGATMRVLGQKFSSSNQASGAPAAVVHLREMDTNTATPIVVKAVTQKFEASPTLDLDGYTGGSAINLYTSGATMRELGQVFSSSDQGANVSVQSIEPGYTPLILNAALLGY
jgi:hypothetical protein